jgi:CubicO group peptidase (beta-lactamase class C family)
VNKNEALTYRYVADWKQEPETHPSILFSAGAIVSTPNDLTKFIQAHGRGRQVRSVAGLPAGRKADARLHYERKGLPGSQNCEWRFDIF